MPAKAALVIAGRHGDGQARWYAELVGHCCGQGIGHGTGFGEVGKQRLVQAEIGDKLVRPAAFGHVIDAPAERIRGIDNGPFAHEARYHKLRGRGAADAAGKLVVGLQPKQMRRSVTGHERTARVGKGGQLSLGGGGTPALGHGV